MTTSTQPRRDTRPGWLETYVGSAYIRRAADFAGRTPRRTFWLNRAWLLLFAGAALGLGTLLVENVFTSGPTGWWVLPPALLALAAAVPSMAIRARRLRSAGWPPSVLAFYAVPLVLLAVWMLVPCAATEGLNGLLLSLCLLCFGATFATFFAQPDKRDEALPATRCQPIDIIVIALCALLWLAGLVKILHDYDRVRWVPDAVTRRTLPRTRTPEPAPTDSLVDQANSVGQSGELKVTLLWEFPGDIDLHVRQPNGREIYYQAPRDRETGGALDVDNTAGGRGSAENVYWTAPPAGTYDISLVYYQPSTRTGRRGRGTCTVVVQQRGRAAKTFRVDMSHVGQRERVATITLQ